MFSDTYRNNSISQTMCWNILESHFWWVTSLRVCHLFSKACSAKVAANRKHNLPQSLGLGKNMSYFASSQEKDVLPVKVVTTYWERISFSCQEANTSRHVQISLLVRALQGNCYIFLKNFFLLNQSPQNMNDYIYNVFWRSSMSDSN